METRRKVINHAVPTQVLPQLADMALFRWEHNFRFLTVLGIVGFSGFGFELIAAIRLTANDQVAAILLTILACAVVLYSLGAILSRRLK